MMVEDVAAAGPRVLALGAIKLAGEDVYADPDDAVADADPIPHFRQKSTWPRATRYFRVTSEVDGSG
jgi:hypothetical protein